MSHESLLQEGICLLVDLDQQKWVDYLGLEGVGRGVVGWGWVQKCDTVSEKVPGSRCLHTVELANSVYLELVDGRN